MRARHHLKAGIRGFTLVELLVVIGIIALLIAILLPVLGKAEASARLVKCMSNERQLAQAMLNYLSEQGNRLPPGGDVNDESASGVYFQYTFWLTPITPYLRMNSTTNWTVDQYNNPTLILQCPEANQLWTNSAYPSGYIWHPGVSNTWAVRSWQGSYSYNNWLYAGAMGSGTASNPAPVWNSNPSWPTVPQEWPCSLSMHTSTSLIPVFCDGNRVDVKPPLYSSANPALPPPDLIDSGDSPPNADADQIWSICTNRHAGKVNIAYLDGHVDSVNLQDIWKQIWCNGWVTPSSLPTLPKH